MQYAAGGRPGRSSSKAVISGCYYQNYPKLYPGGHSCYQYSGAGVGTLVCYVFITFFALYFLCKEAHVRPDMVSIFLKPLAAAVICAGSAYGSYYLLTKVLSSAKLCTLLALVVAVIIYVIALLVLKAFTKTDLLMLPKGEKSQKHLKSGIG